MLSDYSYCNLNGLTIGTIYGIVKRDNAIAVDENFVLVNTLSGIGTIEATRLVIGTIKVAVKQLNILQLQMMPLLLLNSMNGF